jgi:hypothetical protein
MSTYDHVYTIWTKVCADGDMACRLNSRKAIRAAFNETPSVIPLSTVGLTRNAHQSSASPSVGNQAGRLVFVAPNSNEMLTKQDVDV